MANAVMMSEWDQIAWLCLHTPRFTKKKFRLEDFQPMRSSTSTSSLKKLNEVIASKMLPEKLSNEEALAICDKHIAKERDARR